MFRPIRRKNKEISSQEVINLLKSARYGVLAVNGDDGYPYAVPVNYVYIQSDNKIFFHGAKAGHKFDSITLSDKVCFTVIGNETTKDEAWAPYTKSVVVFGRCHIINDKDKRLSALISLAEKFYPSRDLIDEEIARSFSACEMFEIEIEHMSGKEIQQK